MTVHTLKARDPPDDPTYTADPSTRLASVAIRDPTSGAVPSALGWDCDRATPSAA